jgi:Trypsin
MRFRIAGGALAFVVVCAGGCGSGASPVSPPIGHSASAIQGGMVDTSHNFAIGVCGGADGGPEEGQNCTILCSGALIAPNLVLSARHCVDTVSSDTVECGVNTFGSSLFPTDSYFITTDSEVFDPGAHWYQVAQIITPTATAFCGNDLSILILSENVPSAEAPTLAVPEIWYPIDSSQYSTSETAIGYGLDSPTDPSSAGIRRILENIPISCIPNDPDPKLACAPVDDSGVAANEFSAGNGPCEGDSGSSAYEQSNFDKGIFLSLGVLSRGGSSGNTCVGSVYTQLYPWQSLILSAAATAATMGGYSPPAWTHDPTGPVEAGTDAGKTSDGGLKIGSPCGSSDSCASSECVTISTDGGGYICSQKCSATEACPTGFACEMGYCFPGAQTEADTSSSSGGCGCSVAGQPSTGEGWGEPWLVVLGLVGAARVARHSRASRRARTRRSRE